MTENLIPSGRGRFGSVLRSFVIDIRPLRESKSLRALLIGQLGATLSRQTLIVAVPFQVYALTGSPTLVGLVGLAQAIPLLFCSFLGGMLADNLDRRRLLVGVQIGMAFLNILFALATELQSPAMIFGLAAVNSALLGIEAPTRSSIIPLLVRPDLLPSSFALYTMLNRTSGIAGPALTGFVIAYLGFFPAYCIAAIALALGAMSSFRIQGNLRSSDVATGVTWSSLAAGVRFIASRPVLRDCLLIDFFVMALCMPRAVFPVYGVEILGGDAATVGLLYSALGSGGLIGLLTSGWVSRAKRRGRIVVDLVPGNRGFWRH